MTEGKVVIAGATGLVGRALVKKLLTNGYAIAVVSRSPASAMGALTGVQEVCEWPSGEASTFNKFIDGAVAVINLAGESLFPGRLSAARYKRAMETRIQSVRILTSAILAAKKRPAAFLVGSSVGIYGFPEVSSEVVTETTLDGLDHHARSNAIWEHAAAPAAAGGVRTVFLRTGIVWGADGGMFAGQFGQFSRGWGSNVGSGQGWLPWIHVDDEVAMIAFLLARTDLSGPFNLSAPDPIRYTDYATMLGEITQKRLRKPMPEFVLRAMMGMTADMVIRNRRMIPQRATESGYKFVFPGAKEALMDLARRTGAPESFKQHLAHMAR
jgi:uncharacterized protein